MNLKKVKQYILAYHMAMQSVVSINYRKHCNCMITEIRTKLVKSKTEVILDSTNKGLIIGVLLMNSNVLFVVQTHKDIKTVPLSRLQQL